MQVCTLLQTDNHASTLPLSFLQAGCPSCRPTNSVKALKVLKQDQIKSCQATAAARIAYRSVATISLIRGAQKKKWLTSEFVIKEKKINYETTLSWLQETEHPWGQKPPLVEFFVLVRQWQCNAQNTHNRLTALCPGLPRSAGTRRNIHPLTPILFIRYPLSTSSRTHTHTHTPV